MNLKDTFNKRSKTRTPALMVQGTCSNAGKSVLAAALCRILLEDGVSVAPFKSQNMSLNSFVTRDGGEMGRAQVVQAQACLLDPDVRMNPILLKPSSNTGSQIIVMGQPVANMNVEQYIDYKPLAFSKAQEAYDSLAAEHDVMILEGAGSPAEVNLKHHDIVNMPMARYAGANVLLAGDIDRGGIFASFIGTLAILDQWERDLIAGFIINRFRGRKELLAPAITFTENHTGLPTFGVVDYINNLDLPEEDSVSFKAGLFDENKEGEINIGLINLPHISNFTDFEPFLNEPDVALKTINRPEDLAGINAVIIPGSKNVINDIAWLHTSGLADHIGKNPKQVIVGICGGYQMLGQLIHDPHRVESTGQSMEGLGLLPIETVLAKEKTLIRRQGHHIPSGQPVHGYEIHHGLSKGKKKNLIRFDHNQEAGCDNNNAWGSYLHGIFDSDPFRRWFIDDLRIRQGLKPQGKIMATYDLEPAFTRLAAAVRQELDMDRIYHLLKI